MSIPAFDVGSHSLLGRNIYVEMSVAFVKLASLHVKVCDLNIHSVYFRVEGVGDEEAFQAACDGLVETVEAYCRAYYFDECQGVGSQGNDGICWFLCNVFS